MEFDNNLECFEVYYPDGEVNAAEEDEAEWLEYEVAADSGAGDHVASDQDAPGYAVAESIGSKAGAGFIAADGNRIPNQGQMTLELQGPRGNGEFQNLQSVFQVANVTRPLMSVGKMCDQGHSVLFTKTAGIVKDSTGKTLCTFDRRGGLYTCKMRLKNPKAAAVFRRQGA